MVIMHTQQMAAWREKYRDFGYHLLVANLQAAERFFWDFLSLSNRHCLYSSHHYHTVSYQSQMILSHPIERFV